MTFDRAKEHERRITSKMQRCVHFNGYQTGTCEAGVNYRALVGGPDLGWAVRLPCLADRFPSAEGQTCERVHCASLRLTTREEAETEVRESDASLHRISTCLKAIKQKHGKARGLADEMPCPTGCGGVLRYSIAGVNGHIWGRCSTQNCASWMQ